ncbi:hypothetical protein [Herbaspirillum sp. ST 5-3]|uniref:hypothetical protein n=1 Tax=Herbaspirillum sp. ST 5-3 TaxID=2567936 RepID=UPI0010A30234|nr:hypothetical protein [Herbaspirillum sp. ST 5-3]
MKAKDTYRVLRSVLGPWFKENGFKSQSSSNPVYQRQVGPDFFVVKIRCHHDGWNPYKGSKFSVWIRSGPDPTLDDGAQFQLANYLSLPELEYIRARQNRILQNIPPPPPDYINDMVKGFEKVFKNPTTYIAYFLEDWKQVSRPYSREDHVWFRYFSEEDVRSWAILVHNHVRAIHERWQSDAT